MTKESQKRKKEMLKDLTRWCFDPMGVLVDAIAFKERTYLSFEDYWFRFYQNDETNPNWRTEPKDCDFVLEDEDYEEIRKAIVNEIKQNPQDWKIEKEGELTIVKHKSGRKHWKESFSKYSSPPIGFKEIEYLIEKARNIPFENDNELENWNKKSKCDSCKKKEIKPASEGVCLGYYHGKKEDSRLHVCAECYQQKEAEYLQNYGFIYSYLPEVLRKKGMGYVKDDDAECYEDKKDKNGEILLQQNCLHCQPWKKHENNHELDTNSLLQYFQKNKLDQIVWNKSKGDLIIEYQQGETSVYHDVENNYELYKIKDYLEKNNIDKISLSELKGTTDSNKTENSQNNKILYYLWCTLSVVFIVVCGIIMWLALKRRKVKKAIN